MSNLLFFTVVIPTYNREQFIGNTLESIFSQSYPHYEVIVIDNCSTDNTQEVLNPLIESGKIRFFQNERNCERAFSRNVGLENANGDFVTLLDSDDFMYPNNLSDAAEFATKNPKIKCFQNLYELVDSERNVIYRYKLPSLRDRLQAISNGNFMSCIGNFIHRDIYYDYRFDVSENLTGGEDWEYWLRVLADHDVGRIEKVNNGILQHGGRSINNQSVDTIENGLKYMVAKFRTDEHLSKVYARYLDRIEANTFLYLNLLANDGRLRKRAFGYLTAAVKTNKGVVLTSRFMRSLRRTVLK